MSARPDLDTLKRAAAQAALVEVIAENGGRLSQLAAEQIARNIRRLARKVETLTKERDEAKDYAARAAIGVLLMARRCAKCKSEHLEVRLVSSFCWRKECRACGSAGPFEPIPKRAGA